MTVDLKLSDAAPMLPCICLSVRKASRAISRLYDRALAPAGLTNGQLTLLAHAKLSGPWTMPDLAARLKTERTTLVRNIRLLQCKALLTFVEDVDENRERVVVTTSKGDTVLAQAMPYWARAQATLFEELGTSSWEDAMTAVRVIDQAVLTLTAQTDSSTLVSRAAATVNQKHEPQFDGLREARCTCWVVRRCARALSRFYDERLRSLELKIAQLHVLSAIDAHPDARIVRLVDMLTLDQTTLTRMVRHLVELDYVRKGDVAGQKGRLALTAAGHAILKQALQTWHGTQEEISACLTRESMVQIRDVMAMVSSAAGRAEVAYCG